MSQKRLSKHPSFGERIKKSKGGYILNKNGMPLNRLGVNALKGNNYNW